MEYQARVGNEELSLRIINMLVEELPFLEMEIQKQVDIKRKVDELLYKYEINSKSTAIVTSDILEKAKLYLACKKLEGQSKSTLYHKALELKSFANYFNKPVSTITSMDLRMYIADMDENIKPVTVNNKMSKIKDFFQWLQDEEYIISNPCKKIKDIKGPIVERQPLTDEQIEIIREGLKDVRDKAVLEFFLSTGCRCNEVVNVKIKDIDWYKKTLLVIGKGNKQRRIYFNDRCKIVLNKYLKNRAGNSEYLFCSSRKPYGKITNRGLEIIVKKIGEKTKVGIHLHPHLFRHTFATKALNQGIPIEIVQILLGHSKIETTQIYAKVRENNIEYFYKKLI
ncbi:MAG: site-specific tyrosine recombinase/integron integrase [Clostridium sp.]